MRSIKTTNEAVLQTAVELLLDHSELRIPELQLVMDGTKQKGDGRFGFADIFLLPMVTSLGRSLITILELKYITLEGLLKGKTNNWNSIFSFDEMEQLIDQLSKETDQSLLERKYVYYSKERHQPIVTTVGKILEDGMIQLKSYMDTVAKGKVKERTDSGILDRRVETDKGSDQLKGHVIVWIGRNRYIAWSADVLVTEKMYTKAKGSHY